jgi:hypothetical protein
VLERVVLRHDEHVQAEHGLEEGRVGEGDAVHGVGGEMEADRHGFSFWLKS